MLHTPLEQFQIILLFSIKLFCFDFSITNLVLVNFLVLLLFGAIVLSFSSNATRFKETSFFFIPSTWQVLVETLYEASLQLLFDNINKDGEKYFPFISVIFTFVLFSNLIGLIPYSITTTRYFVVTFTLSFSIFVGINIICIQKHKFHMLSLFIPSNTSFGLALLLVPIEVVSWINYAFFKALPFLGAGFIAHAVADEQDMRKMGGLKKLVPFTYSRMVIGFPFLTGFYSKDVILEVAYGKYILESHFIYVLGSMGALLTAFYVTRLIYLTFLSAPNGYKSVICSAYDSSYKISISLFFLVIPSVLIGFYAKDMLIGFGSDF